MKTNLHRMSMPTLGLALLLFSTGACNTARERDLAAQHEYEREAAELTSMTTSDHKMMERTLDGVQLVDDFSAKAAKVQTERERMAVRHQAEAMKSENLLPQ
jgi:hypothetical protein